VQTDTINPKEKLKIELQKHDIAAGVSLKFKDPVTGGYISFYKMPEGAPRLRMPNSETLKLGRLEYGDYNLNIKLECDLYIYAPTADNKN